MLAFRPITVVIVLLLSASAAAAACVVTAAGASDRTSAALSLMFAVGLAQIALLTAWLAWGEGLTFWRVALLCGGLAFWSWPMNRWAANGYPQWLFVLTTYAAIIAGVLLLLRVAGVAVLHLPRPLSFTHADENEEADERRQTGRRRRGRRQFSLWTLLSLVTGAAVVTGLLRLSAIPWGHLLEAGALACTFAVFALICLMAGIALPRPAGVILAVVGAAALCAAWLHWLGGKQNYLLVCGALGGYVTLSMQALRSVGYSLRAAQTSIAHASRCGEAGPADAEHADRAA